MVLSVSNIGKSFSEKVILNQISFHLEDNDKAALVGINGVGKTTLLRIIVGQLTADEGLVTFAKGKIFGYLAQNTEVSGEISIYDSLLKVKEPLMLLERKLREMEEAMKEHKGAELEEIMKQYGDANHRFEAEGGYLYRSEIVGILKGLGFSEEEFSRPLNTLSGGQKTRVALGSLLLTKP
ncbi:MAG: ATP-binding cassette domain-containing protein, partial [Lachnospiraceae bacterium]